MAPEIRDLAKQIFQTCCNNQNNHVTIFTIYILSYKDKSTKFQEGNSISFSRPVLEICDLAKQILQGSSNNQNNHVPILTIYIISYKDKGSKFQKGNRISVSTPGKVSEIRDLPKQILQTSSNNQNNHVTTFHTYLISYKDKGTKFQEGNSILFSTPRIVSKIHVHQTSKLYIRTYLTTSLSFLHI